MLDCDNEDISVAQHTANARLITAAPDLLAALIAIRPFVADEAENRGAAGSDMTDYQNEAADALDIIDTAIAQAKGA